MSFALLLAAASLTASAPPPNPHPLARPCNKMAIGTVAGPGTARIQPLGDQPPARHIMAVLRTTPDGCITPIVVRAQVGQQR